MFGVRRSMFSAALTAEAAEKGLPERNPDHDYEHRDEGDVEDVEEDDGEEHVQQAQEAAREQHPDGEAGIPAI